MNEAYEKILRRPRPVSAHRRMPAENRAKLFAPFAALRGFDIAILTKEQDRLLVPRAVPGPDRAAELARVLAALRPGGAVRVTHFVPVRRAGEEERRWHYFGSMDPWRMVANSAFQAPLTPPMPDWRYDPYDNQMGELMVDGRGLDSVQRKWKQEVLELELL